MTRPSNPSPTATSMTRPVRWTSSPAWRCQYSPSRTTPISSSSTLNAMPSTSPGNVTTSSKPTPGRPDTLAMPVATLVIVPTSRGVSFGVNASRTWLIPANALSKSFWRLSGSMFISSSLHRARRSSPTSLFHRRQIIRDAPRHLLPIGGEFNAADQVWRGLEPDADFSREGFVERILYGRALVRGQVKRAAHHRRVRRLS